MTTAASSQRRRSRTNATKMVPRTLTTTESANSPTPTNSHHHSCPRSRADVSKKTSNETIKTTTASSSSSPTGLFNCPNRAQAATATTLSINNKTCRICGSAKDSPATECRPTTTINTKWGLMVVELIRARSMCLTKIFQWRRTWLRSTAISVSFVSLKAHFLQTR